MSNLRTSLRRLGRNPGFTLLIVGLLALGIGASTVIFSLFDAVLLRPLPVRQPEELVRMVQHLPKLLGTRSEFPYHYYQAVDTHAKSFAFTFAETGAFGYGHLVMTRPAPAEEISVDAVTSEFFAALGVPALYGRALLPRDAKEETGTPPAVLSYRFWKRRFGGNPRVIQGSTLAVNQHYFEIVGVMPQDFHGITADTAPDVWIPLRAFPAVAPIKVQRMDLELAGRLKPGVTRLQAQAECRTIWQSAMKDYYESVEKFPPQHAQRLLRRSVALQPLARGTSVLRGQFGGALKLLMACVGFLLLIVCANVAGLLLARAAARQQEFAVRLAVGATRRQLMRQVLAENFLLAVMGAVGGLVIALAAMPLAVRMLPPMRSLNTSLMPLSLDASIDGRVFLFVLAVSLVTMLLFSLSPVIAVSRTNPERLLRASRSSGSVRGRQGLIAFQIALCTFLLVMAGLFVRTLWQLQRVNPGMDVDHIATFTGDLTGYKDASGFVKTLDERVREIPGVVSAAVSSIGVMREHGTFTSVAPEGSEITRADFMNTATNSISPGYFDTMGMRIIDGRGFLASDAPEPKQAGPVNAVVNQAFARRFFPETNPVGKLFGMGFAGVAKGGFKIVGVVSDAQYRSLREPVFPTFYTVQTQFETFVLNVRTHVRPDAIIQPVRKVWDSVGPGVPFLEVDTMAQEVEDTTATNRLTAELALLFGGIAVLLAGVGIYALLAYVVTQRRHEIGIRMALGARPAHIAKLIAAQTAAMTAVGIAAGLGAALFAAPGIRSLLYGISPQDPKSLAAASIFVALTAAAATVLPAVRAIRTEPSETLRCE